MSIEKMTARQLIRQSAVIAGLIGEGENLTNEQALDALITLNEIIDRFNMEQLMCNSTRFIVFNPDGKEVYTFGQGGDIETDIPEFGVSNAYFINDRITWKMTGVDMNQFMTNRNLQNYNMNNVPASIFTFVNSYPNNELHIYPRPNYGEIHLLVTSTLTKYYSLDEFVEVPVLYTRALKYNLASDLRLAYGFVANQDLDARAYGNKKAIMAVNEANNMSVLGIEKQLQGMSGMIPGLVNRAQFFSGGM